MSQSGERVAVVGPSGCGKSSLLALTAGLVAPTSGTVTVDEEVALMPQRDLLVPWRSALRNAALALEAQGVSKAEAARRAAPLFERFGLESFENSRTWELSGGMRQRVAFLRTVLTGRPLLALDEPFGALDSITRAQMQEWLLDALADEPRTLLLVTHDVEEALTLADRMVIVTPRPGRVAAEIAVNRPTRDEPHRLGHLARVRRPQGRGAGGALMNEQPRRALMRWLSPLIAFVLLIAIWELFVRYGGLEQPRRLGPVGRRAHAHRRDRHPAGDATWVTAREALLGLAAACVFGVALGIVLHLSPFLRDATLPVVVASQAVPTVVLAPLLVIAFGFGLSTKILIVAIACFFPVVIGTFDGLRSADPQLIQLLRSLGAGRARILRLAELPAALPRLLGGVRIAATWAFIAAVFAEYAGADAGLGYLIARGTPTFDTSRVYAAILILTAGSLALYGLTALLERRIVPWERHAANQR